MKNLIKSLVLIFTVVLISSCSSSSVNHSEQSQNDFQKEAVMKRLIKRGP